MIYPAETNVVPFIKNTTKSLLPYAKANEIYLSFMSNIPKLAIQYQPFLLAQSILQLLCCMINLLPPKSNIQVRLLFCSERQNIRIEIENTGINLIRISGMCVQNKYLFTANALDNGTVYRLSIPLHLQSIDVNNFSTHNTSGNSLPHFYNELQKRLRSHFTHAEKIIASLHESRPKEALFLQKINTLLQANIDNEGFDTAALCKAMCMSRTQLFRRLKSLIKQAPATYIKNMRLQRSKELLETTDLTVSEVAFKTGFKTVSHFTKIFQERYSVLPSVFRRVRKSATNE